MTMSTAEVKHTPDDVLITKPVERLTNILSALSGVRFCGAFVDEEIVVVHVCGGDLVTVATTVRQSLPVGTLVDFHHSPTLPIP